MPHAWRADGRAGPTWNGVRCMHAVGADAQPGAHAAAGRMRRPTPGWLLHSWHRCFPPRLPTPFRRCGPHALVAAGCLTPCCCRLPGGQAAGQRAAEVVGGRRHDARQCRGGPQRAQRAQRRAPAYIRSVHTRRGRNPARRRRPAPGRRPRAWRGAPGTGTPGPPPWADATPAGPGAAQRSTRPSRASWRRSGSARARCARGAQFNCWMRAMREMAQPVAPPMATAWGAAALALACCAAGLLSWALQRTPGFGAGADRLLLVASCRRRGAQRIAAGAANRARADPCDDLGPPDRAPRRRGHVLLAHAERAGARRASPGARAVPVHRCAGVPCAPCAAGVMRGCMGRAPAHCWHRQLAVAAGGTRALFLLAHAQGTRTGSAACGRRSCLTRAACSGCGDRGPDGPDGSDGGWVGTSRHGGRGGGGTHSVLGCII